MLRVAEQYSGSDTGMQRRANEDSLLARSPLFVVADGMGGAQAGEVASRIAVESFDAAIEGNGAPEDTLASRALAANTRIYELAQHDPDRAGMGTTLTAVYVGEHEVAIAHVGDSRAYCLRDGALQRLTDDHSLVDELIRQGRLTPEEAEDHPQRSIITRALGPEAVVEVDTRSFQARPGDVYLLCSDGLTTMLNEATVTEVLLAHSRLREAGEALIAAANEAGGRDNITVILLRLEEVGGDGATRIRRVPDSVPEQRPHGRGAPAPPTQPDRTEHPPRTAAPRAPGVDPAGAARHRAGRRLGGLAVGVLHRHQRSRAGDALPGRALRTAWRHQALHERLRLRRECGVAERSAQAHPARSLAALGKRRRGADAQPRTGAAERRMSAGGHATEGRA